MIELSVVDTRLITKTIKEKYGFDLSQFAQTSLKYKLAKLMMSYKLSKVDALLYKLEEQPVFFDACIHDLMVASTEMFRDPSLWRWLREVYFASMEDKIIGNIKIWFPLEIDGFELHTLAIILKEMNLLDKAKIIVSVLSDKSIEKIKEGVISIKKLDISTENYKRYQGNTSLDDYINKETSAAALASELLSKVEFVKQNYLFENAPTNVKLILFRNHCIYFTPSMQENVLLELHKSLSPTGHLIIGVKEKIKNITSSNEFEIVNENESVFKKKFTKQS
jgi:chemotaxis protein methyltransferase CheR